jgi:uncharacterized Ntn-hydrolase superfamily protein
VPSSAPSYSVLARDPQTKELAVATLTFASSSYKTFIWGDTPIGVLTLHSPATQSFQAWDTQIWQQTHTATELVNILVQKDAYREYYQIACLDNNARFAFFNGKKSLPQTRTILGSTYYILASLQPDSLIIQRMAKVLESNSNVSLAERTVASLLAALLEGSGSPEKQSASLLVFTPASDLQATEGRLFNLKINNTPNALQQLDTQMRRQLSYLYLRNGDQAAREGNLQKAKDTYKKAADLFPNDTETQYWYGITLADHNLINEACLVLSEVFRKNTKWKERTARLPADGLLHISKKDFERIMSLP